MGGATAILVTFLQKKGIEPPIFPVGKFCSVVPKRSLLMMVCSKRH